MTVLVALVFVAAAALRGYVPGAERGVRGAATESPWSRVAVIVLLIATLAVVVLAVLARLLHRTPSAPRAASRSDWLRGDRAKPTMRASLIAFGLVLGWLVCYLLLNRFLGGGSRNVPSSNSGNAGAATDSARDAGADRPPLPAPSNPGGTLLDYFYGATVVFVLVIAVGTIVASRRKRGPRAPTAADYREEPAPGEDVGSETLARAAEVALAEVGDLSREPRRAIIACYVAMEGALSLLPDSAPRDFDTASEVLARAVEYRALRPDSAVHLVDLFDEARFSPHVMTEVHRDAAVDALTRVLGELRSHA